MAELVIGIAEFINNAIVYNDLTKSRGPDPISRE
jgi:hypothetical protein